ncbi:hypothetical protein J3R83DRAFT_7533 [Lanmaoa asiatica]|nr:hypothetical protein J3R83DRAFT_7533 [Lanmaoa asiatica]
MYTACAHRHLMAWIAVKGNVNFALRTGLELCCQAITLRTLLQILDDRWKRKGARSGSETREVLDSSPHVAYPNFSQRSNMFAKLSLLALALPLVSALTFKTPMDVVSGKNTTFTWTLNGTEPHEYYIFLSGPMYQYLGNVTNPKQTNITAVPDVPPAGAYPLWTHLCAERHIPDQRRQVNSHAIMMAVHSTRALLYTHSPVTTQALTYSHLIHEKGLLLPPAVGSSERDGCVDMAHSPLHSLPSSLGPSELKIQISISPDKTVHDLKRAIAEKLDVEAESTETDLLSYFGLHRMKTHCSCTGSSRHIRSTWSKAHRTHGAIFWLLIRTTTSAHPHKQAGQNPFAEIGVNQNDPSVVRISTVHDERAIHD